MSLRGVSDRDDAREYSDASGPDAHRRRKAGSNANSNRNRDTDTTAREYVDEHRNADAHADATLDRHAHRRGDGSGQPDPQRFVDHGDGTLTDTQTALIWEKKGQSGGLHDENAEYAWAGSGSDNGAECQPDAASASTCSAGDFGFRSARARPRRRWGTRDGRRPRRGS